MSLDVTWLSLFADVPATRLPASLAFWERITGTSAGAPTGDDGEFTPLVPTDGDRYLWLQRVGRDRGGWHPDLHVRDVASAAAHAVRLGARPVRETAELTVLTTPAGQPFCLVRDDDPRPRRRPSAPQWPAGRSLADQLCLDIPAADHPAETEFWAALTGWPYVGTDAPEFRRLNPPGALPVQFLLQRLGDDDAGGPRAHPDMSADNPADEVRRHQDVGATSVRVTEGWTTLRDPAGLIYCVTHRRPGDPHR